MNNKKSILLVSNAFYPEISPRSFRATELAKEFYRQGHQVTVLTKTRPYNYTDFLEKYKIELKMWRKSRLPGVPKSNRRPFSIISRGFGRVLSLLFEYPIIEESFYIRNILRDKDGYDLMISFAVPFTTHWGVAWSRKNKHKIAKTWIADCGDPYMLARLDSFRKPFYFKYMEDLFCSKCDYISVPFEDMKKQFYAKYRSKIKVIPQGFNLNEIKTVPEVKNPIPTFIYAGSVIPGKRDLNNLLENLVQIDGKFKFIIYTNQADLYSNYKVKLGAKIELRAYIDRLNLIEEMSRADFLVNVDSILDTDSNVEAVPSKLIDYALSGRPILNINSSEKNPVVLKEFLNGDYSQRREIDQSNFDINVVAKKFLALVNS